MYIPLLNKTIATLLPCNNALICGGFQKLVFWKSQPCISQVALGSPASIPSYTALLAPDRYEVSFDRGVNSLNVSAL